jgi:hypothetical protein
MLRLTAFPDRASWPRPPIRRLSRRPDAGCSARGRCCWLCCLWNCLHSDPDCLPSLMVRCAATPPVSNDHPRPSFETHRSRDAPQRKPRPIGMRGSTFRSSQTVVILRESGGSSTPRPFGSISAALEYWGRSVKPGDVGCGWCGLSNHPASCRRFHAQRVGPADGRHQVTSHGVVFDI